MLCSTEMGTSFGAVRYYYAASPSMLHDVSILWGFLFFPADPELSAIGVSQAVTVNALWKTEMAAGIPVPQKGYCSPLTRAMRTAVISFDGVMANIPDSLFVVEVSLDSIILLFDREHVLQNCRELNGKHTCDKRRTRSYIHAEFPQLSIEPGLTEADELWHPEKRERWAMVMHRGRLVLEAMFEKDQEMCMSFPEQV